MTLRYLVDETLEDMEATKSAKVRTRKMVSGLLTWCGSLEIIFQVKKKKWTKHMARRLGFFRRASEEARDFWQEDLECKDHGSKSDCNLQDDGDHGRSPKS